MVTRQLPLSVLPLVLLVGSSALAQQASTPAGMTHEQHLADMKRHADAAMGFDQDRTTHHFIITADGGTVAVAAKDVADEASVAQVRRHLQDIAAAFRRGDFGKPLATHGELPPGVPVMQRLREAITYSYAEAAGGGALHIATASSDALAAIHQFLAYQIREHHTGDPIPTSPSRP